MNHRSERTNVLVATTGLAVVLLVSSLSPLVTAAVIATMVGIAVVHRLTAVPLQVVMAEAPSPITSAPRRVPRR